MDTVIFQHLKGSSDQKFLSVFKIQPSFEIKEDGLYFGSQQVYKNFQDRFLIRQGILINNKKEGLHIDINPEDNFYRLIEHYQNGKKNGFQFYSYQMLKCYRMYVDDVQEGDELIYNPDGDLLGYGSYHNGKREGFWEETLEIDEQWGKAKGYYRNGRKIGNWSIVFPED